LKKLFAVLFYGVFVSFAFAQTDWTKHENNPVHGWGGQPTVIMENDTFKMWFAFGMTDSLGLKVVVGYATSLNGIDWTDYPGNPVLDVGALGAWDSRVRDTPCVVKTPSGYKMWYTGADSVGFWADSLALVFGFASSDDGISWSVHPEPVLTKGTFFSWDGVWLESPSVIFENDTFKMWYSGVSVATGEVLGQIGYAVSTDGINWKKDSNNPVVEVGEEGSGEDRIVGACTVIKGDSLYEMWYGGISQADAAVGAIDTINVGYATSLDGIEWEKYNGNPVLTTYFPTWDPDSSGPWAPSVVFSDDEYMMWYEAGGIGLATSLLSGISEPLIITNVNLRVYPNLFTDKTVIEFKLPEIDKPGGRKTINLDIYDLSGRLVKSFTNIYYQRTLNQVVWDGKNNVGKKVNTGIYFCKLSIDNKVLQAEKLLLLK
jgi:predicted GH43/DUF377 family glycosyl hydrolase